MLKTDEETDETDENWEIPEKSNLSPNSASPTRSLKNTYQDLREIPLLDDSPRETPKQKITLTRTSSDTSLESIPDEDEDCEKIEEEQENLFQDVLSSAPSHLLSLSRIFFSPP